MRHLLLLVAVVVLAGCGEDGGNEGNDDGPVVIEQCPEDRVEFEGALVAAGLDGIFERTGGGCIVAPVESLGPQVNETSMVVFKETGECQWESVQTVEGVTEENFSEITASLDCDN